VFTSFKSLSDLFFVFEVTNQVASLSRLMEHFLNLFCGFASRSLNFMMETDDDDEVDESDEISGALSMMIVVTLPRLDENVTAVSMPTC
jgi:hypothetical protein